MAICCHDGQGGQNLTILSIDTCFLVRDTNNSYMPPILVTKGCGRVTVMVKLFTFKDRDCWYASRTAGDISRVVQRPYLMVCAY